jgi:hypothetical protein
MFASNGTGDPTWTPLGTKNYRVLQVTTHNHDHLIPNVGPWRPYHRRGVKHRDNVLVGPGQTYAFPAMEGPGLITNIWLTATPMSPMNKAAPPDPAKQSIGDLLRAATMVPRMVRYHRLTRLLTEVHIRITCDGASDPQVDVPLGIFFGSGFGEYKHFMSAYVGMTAGGYVAQFKMPFWRSARVEIVNHSGSHGITAFYGAVTQIRFPDASPLAGHFYFRTSHRREWPTRFEVPYDALVDEGGPGTVLGVVLNARGRQRNRHWTFLEGNMQVFVDGEEEPSVEFTGTEDVFQGAWYYTKGVGRTEREFAAPFHGLTVASLNRWGSIGNTIIAHFKRLKASQYRFFPEGIPYGRTVRVVIHHGEFDEAPCDYETLVYYYRGRGE